MQSVKKKLLKQGIKKNVQPYKQTRGLQLRCATKNYLMTNKRQITRGTDRRAHLQVVLGAACIRPPPPLHRGDYTPRLRIQPSQISKMEGEGISFIIRFYLVRISNYIVFEMFLNIARITGILQRNKKNLERMRMGGGWEGGAGRGREISIFVR